MHEALGLLGWGAALSALAIALVAALRGAVGRWAGAEARYALWLVVPVLLLSVAAAAALPRETLAWQVMLPAGDWQAGAGALPQLLSAAVEAPHTVAWLQSALMLLWAMGVAGLVLAFAAQHRSYARRPLPAGASASLQGAWRPRVRLPADFRSCYPVAERRLILLHERVHAERGDTRWMALALSLLVLQWFNPAAWWAIRRMRQDMELAADAAVLRRRPHAFAGYRRALLRSQTRCTAPLTVSPCAAHPLVERIAMLPLHVQRPYRRSAVALLLVAVAGLAAAVQPLPPSAPPMPSPPPVRVAPAAPAAPVVEAAVPLPAPTAPKAAPPAPALPKVAPPEPPAPVVPPVQDGYSKLRLDMAVTVNGQRLPPQLLVQTFNEVMPQYFRLDDGSGIRLSVSGRPYEGDAAQGKDLILLELTLVDAQTNLLLARPRLITKDGVRAVIETGEEGGRMVRVDVMPRFVLTRLHDARGALAELQRDIEAGQAPGLYFKP